MLGSAGLFPDMQGLLKQWLRLFVVALLSVVDWVRSKGSSVRALYLCGKEQAPMR